MDSVVAVDAVTREGEPVPAGTEIEIDGLSWVIVGAECVDRGFYFFDFLGSRGNGIVRGIGISILSQSYSVGIIIGAGASFILARKKMPAYS